MPENQLISGTPGAEGAAPGDACPVPSAAAPAPPAASRGPEGGRVAAIIYVGTSFVAALVFWLVTTFVGAYPAVARYGGAAWVFILFMIVLMPIVIPRVRNRRRQRRSLDDTCTIE